MKSLSETWFAEGRIDFELKKYTLLAYLQEVNKHFDALIWQGLGLDRHPELLAMYFGNYTRLVLLSQTTDATVITAATAAAERLGLRFEHHHVGLSPFQQAVTVTLRKQR